MKESALATVPKSKSSKNENIVDENLTLLVNERKKLYLDLKSVVDPMKLKSLRTKINRIRRNVNKSINKIQTEKATKIIDSIEELVDDDRKMYNAVKELKMNKKFVVKVKDAEGRHFLTESQKVNAIKDWFEDKLNDTEEPIILKKGALKYPITINEVRKARKKLKNTTGPDDVQNELLKQSGPFFDRVYINIINKAIENG